MIFFIVVWHLWDLWSLFLLLFPHYAEPNPKMCLHLAHICTFALYFVYQSLFMIQYVFKKHIKIGGGFIWAAYSNCGGIYLSLVPVGQVIRLTQQERPPAHFCQRWKNKDSISYSGKRKKLPSDGNMFLCLFFSCLIDLVLDALSMKLKSSLVCWFSDNLFAKR